MIFKIISYIFQNHRYENKNIGYDFLFHNHPILHMNSTVGKAGQFLIANKKTPVKGRG